MAGKLRNRRSLAGRGKQKEGVSKHRVLRAVWKLPSPDLYGFPSSALLVRHQIVKQTTADLGPMLVNIDLDTDIFKHIDSGIDDCEIFFTIRIDHHYWPLAVRVCLHNRF
jgi:hypothetical protein